MRIRCLGIGILGALLLPTAPALAANATVTANPALTFTPQTAYVNTGQMVTWSNGGGIHNVHFDDDSYVQPPTAQSGAWSVSRTFNTPGKFRYYCDAHGGPNGFGMSGTVQVSGPYIRPLSAQRLQTSLSVAFKECTTPNRTHGPPLSGGSCNPPVQQSDWLTMGPSSTGSVTVTVLQGTPPVTAEDADVRLVTSITDVRNKTGPSAYAGELQVRLPLRLTDRLTGPAADEPATVSDTTFTFTVPCTVVGTGSTCSITTTADALQPGAVLEGKRTVWDLNAVQVFDGGSDGVVSTAAGNTLFATQAVFIP